MYVVTVAALLTATSAMTSAQENGTCTCGLFTVIQNSGPLPPPQYTVGPVYTLPIETEEEGPCNGNVEAACDLYCDSNMEAFRADGYDLDTVVEVEVAGEVVNATIGSIMCEQSYTLHPDQGRYAGTAEGGEPVKLAVSINAGSCADWTIRREYLDLLLCCSGQNEYFPCDTSTL